MRRDCYDGCMQTPLVTFIMPTYNRTGSILTAIESIRAQTEPRWELIVVDDAGTDNTAAVIAGLHDERIRYYRQEANRGPGAARNAGFAHAAAEWVAYLDSDNELFPDYLSTMLEQVARQPKAVFAFPRAHRTEELWQDGKLIKLIDDSADTPPSLTLKDIFMKKLNVDTNGFMHRRSVFTDDGIRWDEHLRHGMEDWDLAMQIGERHPDGFMYVPVVLYHYHQRYGGDGVVSNSEYQDWADTLEYIYQKHKNDQLMAGQDWYPRKVEKWQRLQKEYEAGQLPPYYLYRFQDVPETGKVT
jgi:glycosyltransferase involved in cell wall biosynthesis